MEVILLEKIVNLGDLGDKVKVKPGYGRNFLLPMGKALSATTENLKVFEARKAELIKKAQDSLSGAKMRAGLLSGKVLTVRALVAEEGKLYGSVGPNEIVHAAEAAGLQIQKAEVILAHGPIRQTGSYPVTVRLHSEVETEITLVVEEEKAE